MRLYLSKIGLMAPLLLWAISVGAAQPTSKDARTDEKLAQLDAEILRLELVRNRLIWETYLQYAEEIRLTPNVMNYPELDYKTVCTTVPEIKALHEAYIAANEPYLKVLKSDSLYEAIHREYVGLKNINDELRKNANLEQYNLLYDRLRQNNPAYAPAKEAREEALRLRNMGVLRYLVSRSLSQQQVLPIRPFVLSVSTTMTELDRRCPQLNILAGELLVLRGLRRELYTQQQRDRYGIPKEPAMK